MTKKISRLQTFRIVFACIALAVLAALAVGYFATQNKGVPGSPLAVAPSFVPEYELVNQDGQIVTQDTYAGEYQLVYFGFTSCPEICPTELQKMTLALQNLPEEMENEIVPILISVDPERDTPDVMKRYLESFHPNFKGFTGTENSVDKAMEGFKVYASRVDDPNYSDYMMNHSSYIYFIAPNGDLLKLYKTEDTPDFIAADMQSFMES